MKQETKQTPSSSIHEEGKNFLCVVPGYGNILCRMDKYVSDTCVYLRVLTGNLKGGLINVAKGEFIEIPESDTIKIIL